MSRDTKDAAEASALTPQERHRMRIRRLRISVAATRLQMERFGPRTTLGEFFTRLVADLAALEGEKLTPAELAERAGQSPQNVSRWLEKDENLRLLDHPDDGRAKIIDVVDVGVIEEYVDAMLRQELEVLKDTVESGRLGRYLSDDDIRG